MIRVAGCLMTESARDQILEQAAEAIESLFVEKQGHCPSEIYEDGYSDAIAAAASAVRLLKLKVPAPWEPQKS